MAIVFGRRAERAAFGQMEGQPGAAAAVLENVGRGWTVTPAVAMNRSQDVVHRAVGKPGIVLVAEGNPNRLRVAAGLREEEDGAGRLPTCPCTTSSSATRRARCR